MKKIVIMALTFIMVCTLTTAEAQTLSKKERKALKKEIKAYKKSPEKWVKMQKKHKTTVNDLSGEVAELKAKLAALELEQQKINAEKQELADKLAALEAQYASLKSSQNSTELPMGIVYQVQMGYYQYLDLMSFNEKLKTVKVEEVDGAKRYVIGHFDNLMDALQFSNDIKTLGIKDSFVSQYVDGDRNMSFDALKEIGQ